MVENAVNDVYIQQIVNAHHMKNYNAFFVLGTTGMVVTAVLHIFIALILSLAGAHLAFFAMYAMFLSLLTLGFRQLLKHQPITVTHPTRR